MRRSALARDATRSRPAPADFAAFVGDGERLLATCLDLTGNDQTAMLLREDLLAATALRWRWYRARRAVARRRAATAYLTRLVRRERRSWGHDPPGLSVEPALAAPTGRALADAVWRRAIRVRRGRRLVALLAVVALSLVWTIVPRALPGPGPDGITGPRTVPEGVTVLPPYDRLGTLGTAETALPPEIHVDLASAPRLADHPVSRAISVLRPELGPLVVVAPDGSIRVVDDTRLLGAQTLTTSLSPDGTMVALPASEGLLVLDVGAATLRTIPLPAARLGGRALTWRTPTSVVVPGIEVALEVNVDTGAVTELPGLTGYDVMTTVGVPAAALTELLTASVGADRPRIRVWGESARPQYPDRSRPGLANTTAAEPQFQDRAIGGPFWLDDWTGPGWSSGTVAARACTSRSIPLPTVVGRARSVVGAVGLTGAYAGTLVAVDSTVLEVLGFAGPRRVLVAVHSPQVATTIVAWYPHTAQVRRVSTVDMYARVSLSDLLLPI